MLQTLNRLGRAQEGWGTCVDGCEASQAGCGGVDVVLGILKDVLQSNASLSRVLLLGLPHDGLGVAATELIHHFRNDLVVRASRGTPCCRRMAMTGCLQWAPAGAEQGEP